MFKLKVEREVLVRNPIQWLVNTSGLSFEFFILFLQPSCFLPTFLKVVFAPSHENVLWVTLPLILHSYPSIGVSTIQVWFLCAGRM